VSIRSSSAVCEHPQFISFPDALNGGVLPGLQRVMSLKVADKLHGQLLDRYQVRLACADSRAAVEQHLARLHSVQHSVATAWLNILPVKE
jgi:outer membrane protein TolC